MERAKALLATALLFLFDKCFYTPEDAGAALGRATVDAAKSVFAAPHEYEECGTRSSRNDWLLRMWRSASSIIEGSIRGYDASSKKTIE